MLERFFVLCYTFTILKRFSHRGFIMPEKIEIDLYQFITKELEKFESRMDRRFDEMKAGTDRRFDEMKIGTDRRFDEMKIGTDKRFDEFGRRFDKLEDEVRWPRRIAIGGVITTVIAVGVAIFGLMT